MASTKRGRIAAIIIWPLLLAAAAVAWHVWHDIGWRPPDRWNPFAPLRIDETPGWLTRYKLARLDGDPQRCLAVLDGSGFDFRPLADHHPAPGCGFDDAVRISRSASALSAPLTLSCPAAVSLALWERHVVRPAAGRHLQQPIARLDHLGSYVCRNVYGRPDGPRSRHASADAIDIAGVTLSGGRRIRLVDGWSGSGADATFLREIRDGACRFFDGVLSPDYNAAHADHLHLERHGYRVCR
ncbi:extensin family protein [Piscinibacter sakaiensis]|uniref:extensin-like domain-containing protein n=1 Tax=Piscinibacter sakaiensis TaxID=1547922 RepID=UPI003AAE4D86